MNLNQHEIKTVLRIRKLDTGFREEFQRLLQSLLNEQERTLAMIEQYEADTDGERYLLDCEADRTERLYF